MSTCKCIIQSGSRKGEKCGRKLKVGNTTCGFHAKTCIVDSPRINKNLVNAPSRKEVSTHLRRDILKFINHLVLDENLDVLTQSMVKKAIKDRFGIKNTRPYMPYLEEISIQKLELLQKSDCAKCYKNLKGLYEYVV